MAQRSWIPKKTTLAEKWEAAVQKDQERVVAPRKAPNRRLLGATAALLRAAGALPKDARPAERSDADKADVQPAASPISRPVPATPEPAAEEPAEAAEAENSLLEASFMSAMDELEASPKPSPMKAMPMDTPKKARWADEPMKTPDAAMDEPMDAPADAPADEKAADEPDALIEHARSLIQRFKPADKPAELAPAAPAETPEDVLAADAPAEMPSDLLMDAPADTPVDVLAADMPMDTPLETPLDAPAVAMPMDTPTKGPVAFALDESVDAEALDETVLAFPPCDTDFEQVEQELLEFCLGGADALLEAALEGDLDGADASESLAVAMAEDCLGTMGDSDDDEDGPMALRMELGDCDSEAGSVCSNDNDLDDMFDFDPDKMAELMNGGATVDELADHLQDLWAENLEKRLLEQPDPIEGDAQEDGDRPTMMSLDTLMTPTLTPNMTPLTTPKNAGSPRKLMTLLEDRVADEAAADEVEERRQSQAADRRRKSEACRRRSSLARRESLGLEKVAAAGRKSLVRIQELATSGLTDGLADEDLDEVKGAIGKAVAKAGERHRRSIAKTAEILEAVADAAGEDLDTWEEEKVDERASLIQEAMEVARKAHRRSIAEAVKQTVEASKFSAAAKPFVPAASPSKEPREAADWSPSPDALAHLPMEQRIQQAMYMAQDRKRSEETTVEQRMQQAVAMAHARKNAERAEKESAQERIQQAVAAAYAQKRGAWQQAAAAPESGTVEERIQQAVQLAHARKRGEAPSTAQAVATGPPPEAATVQERIQQAMAKAQARQRGEEFLETPQASPQPSPQKGDTWNSPWGQEAAWEQQQQQQQQQRLVHLGHSGPFDGAGAVVGTRRFARRAGRLKGHTFFCTGPSSHRSQN